MVIISFHSFNDQAIKIDGLGYCVFNNISVISWRSVLLVEETGVPGENHRPATSHRQTLSHNVVSNAPRLSGVRHHNVKNRYHEPTFSIHRSIQKWNISSRLLTITMMPIVGHSNTNICRGDKPVSKYNTSEI
jgi:hypothetical protein